MKLAAATLLALLVLLAPSAHAGRMPTPPQLTIHYYANPACDDLACSSPPTNEIWLPYGRASDRFEVAHEIGHIWFYRIPTDQQRAWFIHRLGLPVTEAGGQLVEGGWYRGTGVHGHDSPDERAADAYANCDLGRVPAGIRRRDGSLLLKWHTAYGYHPTVRQHRRICNAISILGYFHNRYTGQYVSRAD